MSEIPEAAVEAAARTMQHLYETAGEEPERIWDELSEPEKEEWRGDARGTLQAALPAIRAAEQERLRAALLSDEAMEAASAAYFMAEEGALAEDILRPIIQAALPTLTEAGE